MAKYKIEYLPIALTDLDEIFDYIADDDLSVAANLLNELDSVILNLEDFPSMGAIPKNRRLVNKGYRILIVDNYLVFYVIDDDVIEIRRIVSSKRNYAKLL